MKLIIAKDERTFLDQAIEILLAATKTQPKGPGYSTAALSGGSTPQKLFKDLSDSSRHKIPWTELHLFWVDERFVAPQSEESNFGMADRLLLSKVKIPQKNIHRIPTEVSSPREAATSYDNHLRSFFDLSKTPPRFDIIFLGVGTDGHTASLFPKTEALKETEHWAAPNFVPGVVAPRITLTFPVLNNAKTVVVLCQGQQKAQIVQEIFHEDAPASKYPIQKVKPRDGELIWIFDREASAKLPPKLQWEAAHV